jgi:hypothetical protein
MTDSLAVGTTFPSASHIKECCRARALNQGWTVCVKKSDKSRILIGCRQSGDCPFQVRAISAALNDISFWRITKSVEEHNCEGAPAPIRSEQSKITYLTQVVPSWLTVTPKTSTLEIMRVVAARTGGDITKHQARKLKRELLKNTLEHQLLQSHRAAARVVPMCGRCGEKGHNKRTCTKQVEVPTFENQPAFVHLPAWAARPSLENHPPSTSQTPSCNIAHFEYWLGRETPNSVWQ